MTDENSQMNELIEKVRTLTAAKWDNERIIQSLFDAGVSKGDAIFALSRGGGVSRADAIRIVHHSKAYEARKAVDAAWNNTLCDWLEDENFFTTSLESGRDGDESDESISGGDPTEP